MVPTFEGERRGGLAEGSCFNLLQVQTACRFSRMKPDFLMLWPMFLKKGALPPSQGVSGHLLLARRGNFAGLIAMDSG